MTQGAAESKVCKQQFTNISTSTTLAPATFTEATPTKATSTEATSTEATSTEATSTETSTSTYTATSTTAKAASDTIPRRNRYHSIALHSASACEQNATIGDSTNDGKIQLLPLHHLPIKGKSENFFWKLLQILLIILTAMNMMRQVICKYFVFKNSLESISNFLITRIVDLYYEVGNETKKEPKKRRSKKEKAHDCRGIMFNVFKIAQSICSYLIKMVKYKMESMLIKFIYIASLINTLNEGTANGYKHGKTFCSFGTQKPAKLLKAKEKGKIIKNNYKPKSANREQDFDFAYLRSRRKNMFT